MKLTETELLQLVQQTGEQELDMAVQSAVYMFLGITSTKKWK